MNIALIHSYIIASTPLLWLNEPMGLICLASYLDDVDKEGNYDVSLVDLYALGHDKITSHGKEFSIGISDEEEIYRLVKEKNPDIIGINSNFTTYTEAVILTVNSLKKRFPDVPIVIGGAHATMDSANLLKQTKADIIVRGEGEATFHQIVEAVRQGQSWEEIQGITYRKNGEIVSNPDQTLIKDIDSIPIPNRNYIDQELYSEINKQMYFLSKGKKVASIMTSRGCPYDCTFCSTKVVWERNFRPTSTEGVMREIDMLVHDYGIEEIIINDDLFFTQMKRVHSILDAIIERDYKISINVASGTSVWLVDEDILKKLKRAGLYRITFPIETGNENAKRYIKKRIDFDRTRELVKTANKIGLWTYANFIIGFPYETREDILQTINYALSLGLDNATFFIAKPYAGSEMYEHFEKEGLLPDGAGPSTMGEATYDTIHLKSSDLTELARKANNQNLKTVFSNYLNPGFFKNYVFPKIKSVDGLAYLIKYPFRTANRMYFKPVISDLKIKMQYRMASFL